MLEQCGNLFGHFQGWRPVADSRPEFGATSEKGQGIGARPASEIQERLDTLQVDLSSHLWRHLTRPLMHGPGELAPIVRVIRVLVLYRTSRFD